MIDYRALAVSETNAVKLRVLEFIDGSADPLSAKDISEAFREGLSKVAYHCRDLRSKGFIELSHEVVRGPAVEHFYKAKASS